MARLVAQGHYRIESQTGEYMAVMIQGRRVNHLLHFFIGLFTLGTWWVVWALVTIFGGEKRSILQVDEYGNLLNQKA